MVTAKIVHLARAQGVDPQNEGSVFRLRRRTVHQRGQRADGGCLRSSRGFTLAPRNVGTPLRGTPGSQGDPRVTYWLPWGVLWQTLKFHGRPRHSGSADCSTLIILPPT